MEWIKIIIIIHLLLLPGYNHLYNRPPKISVKSIELSLSDYLMKFTRSSSISSSSSSSSSSSPSFMNVHRSKNLCLLLRIPNSKLMNDQINLLKIYLRSHGVSDINKLWAIFQLDPNEQSSLALKYVNHSLDIPYSMIKYPLFKSIDSLYIFIFTIINNGNSKINYQLFGELFSSMYPSCLSSNSLNDFPEFCVSLIPCDDFMRNTEETSKLNHIYRRVKRDTSLSSQTLNTSNTTMNNESKPGLSPGILAIVIIIPILVIIGLSIGGYFLYRWLHKRRSSHGIYQPNYMENEANLSKEPEPHTIVKIPQEERLI